MAQFQAFDKNVEVNGEVVHSILEGMGDYREIGLQILERNGIKSPEKGEWYNLQNLMDSFREIDEKLGSDTLFLIGSKIPEVAIFPPGIENMEDGMPLIDQAYNMNHRGGDIGYYKFSMVDENNAVMEAKNPYPCEFDRGLVTGFAKIFPPKNVTEDGVTVILDDEKESRLDGGDTSWYLIFW